MQTKTTSKIFALIFLVFVSKTFSHPGVGIVRNSKGEVFYTDTERVWKITADGKTKKIVVNNVHTHELSIDVYDNIYGENLWYENEKWTHYVWKYSSDGHITKVIPNTEGFLQNYSFNRDAQGNLFWLERGKKESVFMKKSSGGKIEAIATIATKDVRWQFCSKSGNFYFIDDNDLIKINNGITSTIAKDLDGLIDENPARKPNNNTFGLWDDESGNIYVAVSSKKEVKKVMLNGSVSVVYKSVADWSPTGGLMDRNKKLWVLECDTHNKVRVVKK
jgi:hypothetical protein